MARVDVCYNDLSGIYVDKKWMPVSSIDVNRTDHPGEVVYELGSSVPIVISDPRPEWTVRVELENGPKGPTMEMVLNDPEVHFWSKRDEYIAHEEMYVIQEMSP